MNGKNIKLQIWDTAGQERFRTITQTYYKGAMGIILAYDCTNENSFKNIKSWVKQIDTHASPGVIKVLISTKNDRSDKKIPTESGKKLAEELKMGFFETSAKHDLNVKEVFYYMAEQIQEKIGLMPAFQGIIGDRLKLDKEKFAKKKKSGIKPGCCI